MILLLLGELHFLPGQISEDVLPDNCRPYEHGLRHQRPGRRRRPQPHHNPLGIGVLISKSPRSPLTDDPAAPPVLKM